jgi:hypothetical protein
MNRPGKFTVEITATDQLTKKTASYKLPVTVLPRIEGASEDL